jgi:hypothetical protein
VRLPAVPGVTPVALGSVEETAGELLAVLRRVKGRDAARDPALEIAATQTAERAHELGAKLVAVVEHAGADPALLVAWLVPGRLPDHSQAAAGLEAVAGANTLAGHERGAPAVDEELREVTRTRTARGYPAVIVERILLAGAQLQVAVEDPTRARLAVFTLHSPTGRGWLDVAATAGAFVAGLAFEQLSGPAPRPGTRAGSARRPAGTPGRSAQD